MNKFVMTAALAATLGIVGVANADDHKGHDKMEKMKQHMLEKIDTDGNNVISKAEFLASHEEKFTMMDTDKSGDLTSDELTAAHEKMMEKRKEWREKRKEAKEEVAE